VGVEGFEPQRIPRSQFYRLDPATVQEPTPVDNQ